MTDNQINKIEKYLEALLAGNRVQNLISFKNPSEIREKHLKDILIPFSDEDFKISGKVADMGSGGGMPGVILAILFPESDFTLVETEGRKAEFLAGVLTDLEIRNAKVYKGRLETFGKEERGKFDFITSRALAPIRICCEYAAPLLKLNGTLLLLKGPNYAEELLESSNALEQLKLSEDKIFEYELDYEDMKFLRCLISIKKHGETPSKYPRKPGMARKRPL